MLSLYQIKHMLNPEKNTDPTDDFRIIQSWAEYDAESSDIPEQRTLHYLCYELETMNPETGERTHYYKAIKFARVERLPADAKQSTSLMDIQEQVLSAVWERGINLVTVIANVIKPKAIGLLYLYGVQGVSKSLKDAKQRAHYDFEAFVRSMQGSFRVLHMRVANAEESEWLREKMYNMDYMTVLRGIPKANKSGEDAGNKGMGGKNLNPDSQGTLEEIIAGMVDYEYVIEVLSTPVYHETLEGWHRQSYEKMTVWYGQLQGQKSLSFNLSIPMMYMSNASQSQGWSKAYTDANSVNYSRGESFTASEGQSVGQSLTQTLGKSFGQTSGTSLTNSYSQGVSHNRGVGFGESFGESEGFSQNYTHGVSRGTSHNIGVSQNAGTSQNFGTSMGQSQNRGMSQNLGESIGQSFNKSTGISQNQGISQGSSFSQGQSQSSTLNHSVGNNQNLGFSQNDSVSLSNSASRGQSVGESYNKGFAEGYSAGKSYNSNMGTNTSANHNDGVNGANSYGGSDSTGTSGGVNFFGGNFGLSHNDGMNESLSSGWNEGAGVGFGSSWGEGRGASFAHSGSTSESAGLTYGENVGLSESIGNTIGYGKTFSTGVSESYGNSIGNSISKNWAVNTGMSESRGISNSVGEGLNIGNTSSFGASVGFGQNYGLTAGTGTTYSQGVSEGFGINEGVSDSFGQGYNVGVNHSQNYSMNESVGESQTLGQSIGQSVSNSATESASLGYGQNVGQSESVSRGQSYSTGQGTSRSLSNGTTGTAALGTSSSLGLGPSIGYSKSYQWMDQGVKDLIEMLEYENNRIKKGLRTGAFYTYMYIACPSMDALSAAQAIAKSTWQNEFALVKPLQVIDLNEVEQKHLLYHFDAFSSDITREEVCGIRQYKYCTVLLPEEFVAYTHLPRVTEGGIFSDVQDIPKFAVPSNLPGEIYMGTILNAGRYTFENGYRTPYDYRIEESMLMHGFFCGQSRSGKTVAATRFITELANIRRKKTGKRLRIIVMDPKNDWRVLARFIDPERFHFYSMGNPKFRGVKINPWKVPYGVWPQQWIDGVIDIYCRSYGLLERGKQMIADVVYGLYQDAGVFDACDREDWKEVVPELSAKVCFEKIYNGMVNEKLKRENPEGKFGKSGNDTADAYARLIDRLSCFGRKYAIERMLYGTDEGLGIDELIGEDDVTVLESQGLENTFKNFIFGVITSGFYKYAKAHEGGFLAEDQYETVLVIEEANEILIGSDQKNEFSLPGESEFEQILDQSAGYGMFIFAITQKISDMPTSIIANCGLVFAGKMTRTEDIETVCAAIGKDGRYDDRDVKKWFPRCPTGWFICKTSRTFNFIDAEPILVSIAPLDMPSITNQELDGLLLKQEVLNELEAV